MSKIEKALADAAEIKRKTGEDDQTWYRRLCKEIGELPDKAWEALKPAEQDWINKAVDVINAKTGEAIEDFPDAEKEEPKTRSRTRAAADDAPLAPYVPKLKEIVALVTSRGKNVVGKIVEMDKEVIVLDVDGTETEFPRDRIANIGLAEGARGAGSDEPSGPKDPEVGDTVTIVTKRGKTITGEITELTDEDLVMLVNGEQEEFARDRIESIKVEALDKPAASTGRSRSSAKEEPKKEEEPAKRSRTTNAEGVSVSMRVRELIIEDFDRTQADIEKLLTKEKIEFKSNTVGLNFADVQKTLKILREQKKLK